MAAQYGMTPLAAYKLTLIGDPWKADEWRYRPSFGWDLVNNNPRLTCWPNNPKEAEKLTTRGAKMANQPLSAHMGPFDLQKFFRLMETAIKKENPSLFSLIFNGPVYDKNNNLIKGKIEAKTRIDFGRNADGFIYFKLSDTVEERDPAEYVFRPNRWVTAEINNAELTPAMASSLEAQAYIDTLKAMFPVIMVQYYVPDDRNGREEKEAQAQTLAPPPNVVVDASKAKPTVPALPDAVVPSLDDVSDW
jgi:hypothetical protein